MDLPQGIFEQVFSQSPVGMQMVDASGLTTRVNDAFLRLLGVESRRAVEGMLNMLSDPVYTGNAVAECLSRALTEHGDGGSPFLISTARPAPRRLRVMILPVTDGDDRPIGALLMYDDATEALSANLVLERRYEQIAILQRTFRNIGDAPERSEVISAVMEAMRRLVDADDCAIWLMEVNGHWRCLASHGLSEDYTRGVESLESDGRIVYRDPLRPIAGHRASVNEDILAQPMDDARQSLIVSEGIRAILTVPMVREGHVDGTISFYRRQPGPFDPVDVDVAILLSDQLAVTLHNVSLLQTAREAADEARVLYDISRGLARAVSLPELTRLLNEVVTPRLGIGPVTIGARDVETGRLALLISTSFEAKRADAEAMGRIGDIPAVTGACRRGETIVMREALLDAAVSDEDRAAARALGLDGALLAPLPEHGSFTGLVAFHPRGAARRWTERDRRIAQGVAQQISSALRTADLFEEVQLSRDDLEERVRLRTAALHAAHDEIIASERLAALGIMAREVAHGLRNPLNAISTSQYYLETRLLDCDEKVKRHLNTIMRSVHQAATMINNLSTLAGPRRTELAPLDLNHLVQRIVHDRFTSEEAEWECSWDTVLPYIHGDWFQLNHAVKALMVSVMGLIEGAVHVRTGRAGEMAWLMVGGVCRPLGDEERAGLMEPLSVSSTQWTGLGLNVARQIAVRHGGDLTMEEEDGLTFFRMALRFAPQSA